MSLCCVKNFLMMNAFNAICTIALINVRFFFVQHPNNSMYISFYWVVCIYLISVKPNDGSLRQIFHN